MDYFLTAVGGFLFAVFLFSYDDLKRNFKKKASIKRYRKLAVGIPKHVVYLSSWGDMFKYRKYPIYVNGKVLSVDQFDWWHCNDEYKRLMDSDNKPAGYLISQIVRSNKDPAGGWHHKWGLAISTGPSFLGDLIQPSAVIKVY